MSPLDLILLAQMPEFLANPAELGALAGVLAFIAWSMTHHAKERGKWQSWTDKREASWQRTISASDESQTAITEAQIREVRDLTIAQRELSEAQKQMFTQLSKGQQRIRMDSIKIITLLVTQATGMPQAEAKEWVRNLLGNGEKP